MYVHDSVILIATNQWGTFARTTRIMEDSSLRGVEVQTSAPAGFIGYAGTYTFAAALRAPLRVVVLVGLALCFAHTVCAECLGPECGRKSYVPPRPVPPWHDDTSDAGFAGAREQEPVVMVTTPWTEFTTMPFKFLYFVGVWLLTQLHTVLQLLYNLFFAWPYQTVRPVMEACGHMLLIIFAPIVSLWKVMYTVLIVWPTHTFQSMSLWLYQLYVVIGIGVCFGVAIGLMSVGWLYLERQLYIARAPRTVIIKPK